MKLKIACGTDNEKDFTKNHFGDSEKFLIYEYNTEDQEIKFIKKIDNNSEEEDEHGAAKKARSVSAILQDISIIISFVMGPNVVRMRKKFVPVVSREKDILKTLEKIKTDIPKIINEINLPEGKDKKIFIIN